VVVHWCLAGLQARDSLGYLDDLGAQFPRVRDLVLNSGSQRGAISRVDLSLRLSRDLRQGAL